MYISTFSVSSPPRSRMSKSVSPTREVAPKLVMGSKKYGRRSRPHITQASEEEGKQPGDRSGSENEEKDNEEGEDEEEQIEGQGTIKVHRSASQTDVKRRRQPQTNSGINNSSTKLKRCASLPARRNMAREFVRIRGSSPNKHVKAQLDSSVESLGKILSAQCFFSFIYSWMGFFSSVHSSVDLNIDFQFPSSIYLPTFHSLYSTPTACVGSIRNRSFSRLLLN